MHQSVMEWVSTVVAEHDLADRRVLEVGSRDINGTVRPLFRGEYVGVDMLPGPGVDMVVEPGVLPFPQESFDAVVTTEMLEHDPFFWRTMQDMTRVLAPGGLLVLTTRGIGFPYHEYPSDYWRFTTASINLLFNWVGLFVVDVLPDPEHSGVFGLARKKPRPAP